MKKAMAEMQFAIGAEVSCTDGVCGRVRWVVVYHSAEAWRITHLVVEPAHRVGLARFVPLHLVGGVDGVSGDITLDCTIDQFEHLDSAENTEFVPGTGAYPVYGPAQIIAQPYYTDEPFVRGDLPSLSQTVTTDAPLPDDGDVAVHVTHVHATDGDIGQVAGLVVDPASQHVTHVLLMEGHLWARKEVAIPVAAVKEVADDGIHLNITKQEVGDLPPVDLKHRDKDRDKDRGR
jgi:sporulation protein YlmC with PRC-barrel domain